MRSYVMKNEHWRSIAAITLAPHSDFSSPQRSKTLGRVIRWDPDRRFYVAELAIMKSAHYVGGIRGETDELIPYSFVDSARRERFLAA
jgi:hypothetical protein